MARTLAFFLVVAAFSLSATSGLHGQVLLDLGDEDGLGLNPTSVNDSGQVVATYWYFDASNNIIQQSVLYSNGSESELVPPSGFTQTYARSINDFGQITGLALSSNASNSFLYSGGQSTIVTGFYGAAAVNASGQVVGLTAGGGIGIYSSSNGTLTNLGLPAGGNNAAPLSINATGEVAGEYLNISSGYDNAFVYNGSAFVSLASVVGSGPSSAVSINNARADSWHVQYG